MGLEKFNEFFKKEYNPFDKYKPQPMEPQPIDTYTSKGYDRYKPAPMEPEEVDMSKRGVKLKSTATGGEKPSGKFPEHERDHQLRKMIALLSSEMTSIVFGNDVEQIKEYVNELRELNKKYSHLSKSKSKPMSDIDIDDILNRM